MSSLPIIISRHSRHCQKDRLDNIDLRKTDKSNHILANLPSIFNKYPIDSQKDEESEGHIKENHFKILMDVQQFRPNEITVKTDKIDEKHYVVVEAKHNNRQDKSGYISRQFIRRYSLPRICDIKKVNATLSADGVLSVESPFGKEYTKGNERTV